MTDIGGPTLAVFGAGSIGCYLGGRLLAGGTPVRFVGRPRLRDVLTTQGLRVTDYRGVDHFIAADRIDFATTAAALSEVACVLVTVKSAATAETGRVLREVLTPGCVVISFQNGLRNAEILRAALPRATVLTGMVPFNVVARDDGRFHQGSEGELAVERSEVLAPYRAAFADAGLPLAEYDDMRAVLWAKLLLNLNNAINALSGLPLKHQLGQRDYRRCLALAQREALESLREARIPLARLTRVPPQHLPRVLSVPDFVFHRLAATMLAIDPLARSSMWEDFAAGRATEVDWINGEVVTLARGLGHAAPVNARLVELVHAAEAGGRRNWRAEELLAELRRAG